MSNVPNEECRELGKLLNIFKKFLLLFNYYQNILMKRRMVSDLYLKKFALAVV